LNHLLTGTKSDRAFIEATRIEETVFKYTGISVKLTVLQGLGLGAYVVPPPLDRNHPLMSGVRRWQSNSLLTQHIFNKEAVDKISGTVDLQKGQVGGIFSRIQCPIYMGTSLVQGDRLSPEENAAVFLHEVGHVMTYFEYLGRSVTLNHVLGDLTRKYSEQETYQKRLDIISYVKHTLDLDSIDERRAAEMVDGEALLTLVVSESVMDPINATDTPAYDARSWEALADQFVSRLGGARYLATGLDRKDRLTGSSSYRTNTQHLMIQVCTVIFYSIPVFTPFFLLGLINGVDPKASVHDTPEERLKRLRQDVVDAMKNPKLDKEYRIRLQEDADVIADLLKNMKDREGLFSFLWTRLRPGSYRQFKRGNMITELETMANNELFVKANKLTVIAEGETNA
jgi:hypothetical protein